MPAEFRKVAALEDLQEGSMRTVDVGGEAVLLARVDGDVHAVSAICTHGLAYLEDGELEGCEVVCPLHAGAFDVRSGAPTRAPCTRPLQTYPVRIEGPDVLISTHAGQGA